MKIPETNLPLFPLHTVLFPQARLPLQIFEPRYIEMIGLCLKNDWAFGVILIREGSEVGEPATPHEIGTIARIVDVARQNDGRMSIVVQGVTRFKLIDYATTESYMTGNFQLWRDEDVNISKAEAVARAAARSFTGYAKALQNIAATEEQERDEENRDDSPQLPKDPTVLSYLIASNLQVSQSDKQSLLEAPTTIARLRREILFMRRELVLLRLVSDKSDRHLDQGTFSLN